MLLALLAITASPGGTLSVIVKTDTPSCAVLPVGDGCIHMLCDKMQATILDQLEEDGFVVFKDFFRPEECEDLVAAGRELTKKSADCSHKAIFSTHDGNKQAQRKTSLTVSTDRVTRERVKKNSFQQLKDSYLLESNDNISLFYEDDAFTADGNLKVPQSVSLNKVGHALHLQHPIFRCFTYSERVKAVCSELGWKEPAVVQSMYIYKNPRLRGEEVPHQDATYLHTEPIPAVRFWIALEDATVQNGCLWIASGSHKSGVHRRLLRNPDKESTELLTYDKPSSVYPESIFKPVPVSKGTCILIHGLVVHKSAYNKSRNSCPAYTFHVVERHNNRYSTENWLQEGENAPFVNMYTTPQIIQFN